MLEKQLPISQDMTIFCLECCKLPSNGTQLMEQFIATIQKVTEKCLSTKDKNNADYDINKARSYAWFKQYLLHSNIWFVKFDKPLESEVVETNTEDTVTATVTATSTTTPATSIQSESQSLLLYDVIESTIEKELMKQKEFIWGHISESQKLQPQLWKQLMKFDNEEKPDNKKYV